MFTKTLSKTLQKVANFVKDIEEGIELNLEDNRVLQAEVDIIEGKKAVNTVEIDLGKKLLEKLT